MKTVIHVWIIQYCIMGHLGWIIRLIFQSEELIIHLTLLNILRRAIICVSLWVNLVKSLNMGIKYIFGLCFVMQRCCWIMQRQWMSTFLLLLRMCTMLSLHYGHVLVLNQVMMNLLMGLRKIWHRQRCVKWFKTNGVLKWHLKNNDIGIFADGELLKRYLRILWKVWRLG